MTTASFRLRYRHQGEDRISEFDQESVTIGRHPQCDLEIDDDSVSRQHAKIVRDASGWKVVDTKSRNGVYVNLRRVTESPIRHRDLVVLGRVEFTFEILSGVPDDSVDAPSFSDEDSDPVVSQSIDVSSFKARLESDTSAGSAPLTDSTLSEDTARVDHFGLFARAAEALIAPEGLENVLRTALRLVFESLPAENGCVIIFDPDTKERSTTVAERRDPLNRAEFTVSNSVVDRVVERNEAILVANSLDDERFSAQQSIVLAEIRSVVCAPLYHAGEVAGVIYLDSRNVGRMFDRSHLEVLTTIAILCGSAVERARLEKQLREESAIRERLSRYSAPSVVERIIQDRSSDDRPEMIAEERVVTVLFLDLVSFTTMSEALSPVEVTILLNEVFEELTNSVFEFEGTLDKFTGDGLMAVFGAPLDQPDHPERAIRAARSMMSSLERIDKNRSQPVVARIGINTGPVLAGDLGSPRRKDYTVIGDPVNVASRLEANVAKSGDIVVGEDTRAGCGADVEWDFEDLGVHDIKGKQQQVRAFRIVER